MITPTSGPGIDSARELRDGKGTAETVNAAAAWARLRQQTTGLGKGTLGGPRCAAAAIQKDAESATERPLAVGTTPTRCGNGIGAQCSSSFRDTKKAPSPPPTAAPSRVLNIWL